MKPHPNVKNNVGSGGIGALARQKEIAVTILASSAGSNIKTLDDLQWARKIAVQGKTTNENLLPAPMRTVRATRWTP